MDKPPELLCLYKAYGCEVYRIDGRVRVGRKWVTNRMDKEAKCKVRIEHTEEAWLDEWHAHTPTLIGVKGQIAAACADWGLLSTTAPAIGSALGKEQK